MSDPNELPPPADNMDVPTAETVASPDQMPAPGRQRRSIAPLWHTAVLIVSLLLFSWLGARNANNLDAEDHSRSATAAHSSASHDAKADAAHDEARDRKLRLSTYGSTLGFEVVFLVWIWFGLRLRGIPFHILLGDRRYGWLRNVGIAAIFWIVALVLLAASNITWLVTAKAIHAVRHPENYSSHFGEKKSSSTESKKNTPAIDEELSTEKPPSALLRLAPSTPFECLLWLCVSVAAGFCEELIFRGYLQQQFSLISGKAAIGAALSALCFGLAHGYEGARVMFAITVFGLLFSMLAIRTRSLKPGMIAHAWHDLITGYALALVKASGYFS